MPSSALFLRYLQTEKFGIINSKQRSPCYDKDTSMPILRIGQLGSEEYWCLVKGFCFIVIEIRLKTGDNFKHFKNTARLRLLKKFRSLAVFLKCSDIRVQWYSIKKWITDSNLTRNRENPDNFEFGLRVCAYYLVKSISKRAFLSNKEGKLRALRLIFVNIQELLSLLLKNTEAQE